MSYEKYKSMSESVNIPKGKLTDEYMFTLEVADLFLFENNIGSTDILDGFVDGKGDGGIDFIFANSKVTLLQGKSSSAMSKEEVINVFDKVIRTINALNKKDYKSYNKKLRSAYLNSIDSVDEYSSIEIILCTKTEINETVRNELNTLFEEGKYSDYQCTIYDNSDIERKRVVFEIEREFINEDKLQLSEPKNHLSFKNQSGYEGYIFNIQASSLKNLYTKHTKQSLFSYNLRDFISNKNVDSGIHETIENDKDNFWFYNNGITIACNGCHLDGDKCKLYDFSIINGAQTTTKIGESDLIDENNDFSVVCKVVIAGSGSLTDNGKFIGKISQASNSQKPIIPRDLKANTREQRELQMKAAQNTRPLAIQIKRGVKAPNHSRVSPWQRVKNEDIGQLILSCILQRPGTSRSGKRKIFDTQKLYNQVFVRKMDYDTLYDLVKLSDYYDEFKIEFCKEDKDIDEIACCRNGKFIVLAIISYFIKLNRSIIANCNDEKLELDNLNSTLIQTYRNDDFREILFDFFDFLVETLNDFYEVKKETLKLTSYSNFFKTDKMYKNTILPLIEDKVSRRSLVKKEIERFIEIFDI